MREGLPKFRHAVNAAAFTTRAREWVAAALRSPAEFASVQTGRRSGSTGVEHHNDWTQAVS